MRVDPPEYRLLSPDSEWPGEYVVEDRFTPGVSPGKEGMERPDEEELKDGMGVWVKRLWLEEGRIWERETISEERPEAFLSIWVDDELKTMANIRERRAMLFRSWRVEVVEVRLGDEGPLAVVAARWDPGLALMMAAWPFGLVGMALGFYKAFPKRQRPRDAESK